MVLAKKGSAGAFAKRSARVIGRAAKTPAGALAANPAPKKPASAKSAASNIAEAKSDSNSSKQDDIICLDADCSEEDEQHLKTIINPSTKCEAFYDAVTKLSDINLVATEHQYLRDIVHKDYAAKLELLLDAGLDPDTFGLLFESVTGSGECFNLLLERGADPLGNQAKRQCTFVAAADEGNSERLSRTAKLKEALWSHPKYKKKGRAQKEWEAAVKRMHAALLREHGPEQYEFCSKWLQENLLTKL